MESMLHAEPSAEETSDVTLDALLEGLHVLDFELRYVYLNNAAARHGRSHREGLLGRRIVECFPAIEDTPLYWSLQHCLEQRVAHVMEHEITYDDGSSSCLELRIQPVPEGLCVFSLDVTARKRAEAELRKSTERAELASRMEILGQLAAGVAHDFNNFLGVILGVGELALSREGGPRAEDVQAMMEAARRSADLTGQLLAYGRRQVLRSEVLDPVAPLRRLLSMLQRLLGSKIELLFRPNLPVGAIEVDASKFEQVVMNLVLNARDAMPDGGKIVVGLSEAGVGADSTTNQATAAMGPRVVLSVTDTGIGMDAATQARVFEPFFTTKAPGRGTGLGLATVYGIVKQSGGDIWLYSEVGHGTTFKVYLPRVTSTPAVKRAPSRPTLTPVSLPPSESCVLVADDDPVLRKLAEDALTRAGFRVLVASSGEQALELCAQQPVKLLVTDLVMPGVHGSELALLASQLRPELKVLCTSGHASAALHEQQKLPPEVAFLEKPYLPSALVQAARELLSDG